VKEVQVSMQRSEGQQNKDVFEPNKVVNSVHSVSRTAHHEESSFSRVFFKVFPTICS
jgi:hypothetical protein